MAPEDIYRAVQHEPFKPVRLFLKDGRRYDITHRNLIMVGRTFVDIGIQAPDEPHGISEGSVFLSPEDVLRVEFIDGAARPSST
jgi:hypothetical protein